MGSRLRTDPERLYEVFFELAKPVDVDEPPYILQQFPNEYNEKEVLKSVPKFAFPYYSHDNSQQFEHFSFVLTDIDSKFKFGFCRISVNSGSSYTCLCIVSCLPWFEVFYHLLDYIASSLNDPSDKPISTLLGLLYDLDSFKPGETVTVAAVSSNAKYCFVCPLDHQLPSVPENWNLTEFVNCLDVNNILLMFASLINERRILLVSRSLRRLTAVAHASAAIIYPMYWQHLYIPVLPPHLLDYCSAPMPFIIGIHSSVMKKLRRPDLGDVVTLDLDANTLTSEYEDLESLPDEVVSTLKRQIKQCLGENKTSGRLVVGDGVSRAFMNALVALIERRELDWIRLTARTCDLMLCEGGYRDALRFRPNEQITFDPDAFIISRPPSMQPFLKKALHLQTFQQFVSDRLDMLNAGQGFSDEFDLQVNLYGDRWGAQSRYKDWLNHMKVQSKKLKREGRDKWQEFTGKVKVKSKKTLKEFRTRIEDSKKDEIPPRSISGNLALVDSHTRPPRPPPPSRNYTPAAAALRQSSRQLMTERVQHYQVIDIADSVLPTESRVAVGERISVDDSAVLESTLRSSDMDLLTDPDILNICKKSYSLEDLAIVSATGSTTTDSESDISPSWVDKLDLAVNSTDANLPAISNSDEISVSANYRTQLAVSNEDSAQRKTINNTATASRHNISGSDVTNTVVAHEEPLIRLDDVTEHDFVDSSTNSTEKMAVVIMNQLESISYAPVPKPRTSKMQAKHSATAEGVASSKPTSTAFSPSSSASSLSRSGSNSAAMDALIQNQNRRPQFQEARAQFIQSSTPPLINVSPRQSSLDQFDPLSSGQLIVDNPESMEANGNEDDLLKEWDLDFNRLSMKPSQTPVVGQQHGALLRPTVLASSQPSGFVSMPNLIQPAPVMPVNFAGGSYLVGYPLQAARQPWIANTPLSRSSLSPCLGKSPIPQQPYVSTAYGPAGSAAKSATLPPRLMAPTATSMQLMQETGTSGMLSGSQNGVEHAYGKPKDTGQNLDSVDHNRVSASPNIADLVSLDIPAAASTTQLATSWEKFE